MFVAALSVIAIALSGQEQAFTFPRTPYQVEAFPGKSLLSRRLVQDEIDMPETIRAKLQRARHEQQEMFKTEPGSVTYEWTPEKDPVAPAEAKAFTDLTPEQRRHLREIYFQRYDVNALADPEVAKLLELSPEQSRYVNQRLTEGHHHGLAAEEEHAALISKNHKEMDRNGPVSVVPREYSLIHFESAHKTQCKVREEMAKARADVRRVLTPSQLAKLEELKGQRMQWDFHLLSSNWGYAKPHPDLVFREDIQEAIGLSEAARQKWAGAKVESRSDPTKLKRMLAELTPAQRVALMRFEIQVDKEFSILRHDVAQWIGLNAHQIDWMLIQAEKVESEGSVKVNREWAKKDQGVSDQAIFESQNAIRADYELKRRQAILSELTPLQRQRWQQLTSRPIPEREAPKPMRGATKRKGGGG